MGSGSEVVADAGGQHAHAVAAVGHDRIGPMQFDQQIADDCFHFRIRRIAFLVIGADSSRSYRVDVDEQPTPALDVVICGQRIALTDLADAIVRTLTTPGLEGESLNIVGPPLLSANQYLDRLEDRCRTKIVRVPTQPWRHYSSSHLKWAVKRLGGTDSIRPSFADWQGRTFASVIDSGKAARLLDWRGMDDVDRLITSGIDDAVEQWFQQ